MHPNRSCPGPLTRRRFLEIGGLALGGLSFADALRLRAASAAETTFSEKNENSVILLYMHGGPSQLETYDLKPNAPTAVRSVFAPISSNVPGLDLCEWFPEQAKIADKLAIIRSIHHTMSSHTDGGIEVLTGKTPDRPDPTSTSISDHPDFGSIVSRLREPHSEGLPRYVAIPNKLYMTRPSYLGQQHAAFSVGDPSDSNYVSPIKRSAPGLDVARLDRRATMLEHFDQFRSVIDSQRQEGGSTNEFEEIAFRMLTSASTAKAFELGQEDPRLRDRYGRHRWGQGCLLARRLAQAGVNVVSVYINTPREGQEYTNWDDHIMNAGRPGHFAKYMKIRLTYFDQAISALIEDLYAQGLDRQIMVVAMGEFGRTPRLSQNQQGAGRDHWPQAMSVLVSGGGLRMGQAIGATNSRAEHPIERPYTPKDLLATIYRHLGIDPDLTFKDTTGRPFPILREGKPIPELI